MTSYPGRGLVPQPPGEEEAGELFGGLASLLWRERELLDRLLYKLTVQRVIFEAGLTRWFEKSDLAVRAAAKALQEHEVARAIETDRILRRYGLAADATLSQLAAVAPQPWPDLLQDHRDALRSLTEEIDEVAEGSRELLSDYETDEEQSDE
jgi:hypothetical protein